MLSEEEKGFIIYWEKNRNREKKIFRQLLIGLPLGLIFALPIMLNYMWGWNKRATMIGNAQFNPLVLIIAIIIIVVFFSIFNRQHKWEMNEQRYLELMKAGEPDIKGD